ncbi:hypothetical protein BDR26DRAFT_1010174 [Obelidium mucronatum]|nr:hypothetical protein BDR26DRAFT_1010174 [Obelidium mucronatum]
MSAPAYTLNLVGAPACIPIDYMMHFAWTATAGNNVLDWIGTYAPGECVPTTATCTVQLSAWSYISTTSSSTSGVLTMKAPSSVGNFTAYYLLKNGYTYAARSTSFYVQSAATCAATASSSTTTTSSTKTSTANVPTSSTTFATTTSTAEIPRYSVSVDSSKCIQASTTISATWTTTQGNAASNDWIGVFPVGSVSIPAPTTAGKYQVYYLLNNRYTIANSSTIFTISASCGVATATSTATPGPTTSPIPSQYSLSLVNYSPCLPVGSMLNFAWVASAGNGLKDYISVNSCTESTCNTTSTMWGFVKSTVGSTNGYLNMPVPTAPGTYIGYYYPDNGSTIAAKCQTFKVAASCDSTTTTTAVTTVSPSPTILPTFAVTVENKCITTGGSFNATWKVTGSGAGSKDWLGVYPVGACSATQCPSSYAAWAYVNTASSKNQNTISLNSPASAWKYQVYYLLSDGYTVAASSLAFQVDVSCPKTR